MAIHELGADSPHYYWDNSIVPVVEIEPGDRVLFEMRDAGDGQVYPGVTLEKFSQRVFKGHPLTGPVFVKGAKPGDALEIEVLEIDTADWGWTGFRPGSGLLPDDFNYNFFHIWDLGKRQEGWAEFRSGIRVPLDPFCGVMGVAWNEAGQHSTAPPRAAGGNMDIKQLTAGCRLQLPVTVEGGLFSTGDCHAAQGDGEVCITAIETPGRVLMRFNLIKHANLPEPRFWIKKQASPVAGQQGYFATTAHHPDLYYASQQAIRYMIEYLVDEYKLSAQEAYILCSVAVDLKISQIVDRPNWTVSAFLPSVLFSA
jgi:acetamidase/formamidase